LTCAGGLFKTLGLFLPPPCPGQKFWSFCCPWFNCWRTPWVCVFVGGSFDFFSPPPFKVGFSLTPPSPFFVVHLDSNVPDLGSTTAKPTPRFQTLFWTVTPFHLEPPGTSIPYPPPAPTPYDFSFVFDAFPLKNSTLGLQATFFLRG